jgi:hypothetical protein
MKNPCEHTALLWLSPHLRSSRVFQARKKGRFQRNMHAYDNICFMEGWIQKMLIPWNAERQDS